MVFDPLEFRQLAKELVSQAPGEAALRTAICREYYGVFLIARDRTGVVGRRKVHKRVRKKVAKVDSGAAGQLSSLAKLRCQADYDLTPPITLTHWERAESIANNLLPRILKM